MCIHKKTLPFPSTELWREELRKIMSDLLLFSCSVLSNSLQPHGLQDARPPCPSLSTGVCPNSCPLSQWCHPIISSSVIPFSSCLQSFPASSGKDLSRVFSNESVLQVASGDQSIGASASASVLTMNIQGWFPLGLTGLIFLLSKWLSRVFSSTTAQKHQCFSTQPFLLSSSHICTWLWKNHSFDQTDLFWQRNVSAF